MFRSFALAAVAAIGLGSTAKADPITFTGPGGPISNFVGFDPQPGNTLNVGGNQAITNFIGGGSGSNVMFQSFSQAQIISAITTSGFAGLPSGADYTAVIGATEKVTAVTGALGNGAATFGFVSASDYAAAGGKTALGTTPYVNYFEIWQGGAASDNLAGTGFNGQGGATLVLAGTLTSLSNPGGIITGNPQGALDQSLDGNQYPANSTQTVNGSFTVTGNITFSNPAYFNGANLAGGTFNLTSNVADPFVQVNPSGAFLIGTTTTGGSGLAVPAGAGLGNATAGTGIGSVNTIDGQSNQVQNDASVTLNAPNTPTVPEPATIAVFGLMAGVGGLVYRRRAVKSAVA